MPNDTFASKMSALLSSFDTLNGHLNNNSASSPGLLQRLDAVHGSLAGTNSTDGVVDKLDDVIASFGYSTSNDSSNSGT